MRSFYELLIEGVLENETTAISRAIVNNIKQSLIYLKLNGYLLFSYGDVNAIDLGTHKPQPITINAQNIPNLIILIERAPRLNVNGSFRPISKIMRIKIDLPVEDWPANITPLINSLKQTLRHELEHSVQDDDSLVKAGDAGREVWAKPSRILGYFINPGEIAAHVSALYKHAKMTQMPATAMIEKYLAGIKEKMARYGYPDEAAEPIIDVIREKWMTYLKVRFPMSR